MKKQTPFDFKSELLTNPAVIKANMSVHSSRKYAGTTLTQNFFNSNFEEEVYLPLEKSYATARPSRVKETPSPAKQEEGRRSVRKSRKKWEETVLEPMRQEKKAEVCYQSSMSRSSSIVNSKDVDDLEQIFIASPQKGQQLVNCETIKCSPRRKTAHKSDKKEEMAGQRPQKAEQKPKTNESKAGMRQIAFHLSNPNEDLLFNQEKQKPTQQKKLKQSAAKQEVGGPKETQAKEMPFLLPKRQFTYQFDENEDEESKMPSPPLEKVSSEPNPVESVLTGSNFFAFKDEGTLRQQLFSPVPEKITLRMEVIRNKTGIISLWPEFHLRFTADKKHVISAKKTSSRPSSTFLVSRNEAQFTQHNCEFIGKVKSGSLGDTYNIFGPGFNPRDAKQIGVKPRELLATLTYSTSLFHSGGPRRFAVYVLQPGYGYYRDFTQVAKYEEEVPLNVLYSYSNNKEKIRVLHNRKPEWVQEAGGYMLNFRGMAPCLSVKNFILEDESTHQEVMLFGKQNDNTFNLDVSSGISPYVAFALAIASFDNRLIF